jgi:hypothetical protein
MILSSSAKIIEPEISDGLDAKTFSRRAKNKLKKSDGLTTFEETSRTRRGAKNNFEDHEILKTVDEKAQKRSIPTEFNIENGDEVKRVPRRAKSSRYNRYIDVVNKSGRSTRGNRATVEKYKRSAGEHDSYRRLQALQKMAKLYPENQIIQNQLSIFTSQYLQNTLRTK